MKAAWSNLLVGMADENQNFDTLLGNLVNSVGTFAENLLPRIKVALSGVAKLIISMGPKIASDLLPKIAEIATSIGQNLIDGLTNSFPELTDTFTSVQSVVESVLTTIKGIIDLFVTLATAIWDKWGTEITAFVQNHFNNIMAVIQHALDFIQNIVSFFTALLQGDWDGAFAALQNIASSAWELIKSIFKTAVDLLNGIIKAGFTLMATIAENLMKLLWTGIQRVWDNIVKWFEDSINALLEWFASLGESFVNIGSQILNWVWDGMKGIWESISSWVSDKVDWLVDKLAFWRKGQGEMSESRGSNRDIDGSHRSGLSYVPFDGYTAILHKGERVLTAQQNANYSNTYGVPINVQQGDIVVQGNADENIIKQIKQAQRQATEDAIKLISRNFNSLSLDATQRAFTG